MGDGVDWWMTDKAPQDRPYQKNAELNLKGAQLRADCEETTTLVSRTPDNIEKVSSLLRRAEALEKEYIDWYQSLPSSWEVETVAWVEHGSIDVRTADVHPGKIHSYSNIRHGTMLINTYAIRLFVHGIILRCIAWLTKPCDYKMAPEYATLSRLGAEIITDIVAGIPYFFGWHQRPDFKPDYQARSPCGSNDLGAGHHALALPNLWPIFVAASSDFVTETQEAYLRGKLHYMEHTLGICGARLLSQVLSCSQMFHLYT